MRQGGKAGKRKAETRRSVGRKSPKHETSGRRELEKRLAEALQREAEALEQQTATAEILRVISGSPTDIEPVLNAVAESALRLCEAQDASIFRRVGDRLLFVAHHGPIAFGPVGEFSIALVRGTANGRSVLDAQTIHVADLQTEVDEYPEGSELARRFGYRTTLNVPLIREGVAIGSISLRRTAVQLFSQRQIDLLQTFADQAVIAIENVRLSAELEGRNRDLTATSEILRVISSSPTDVQPVFDAIADSALHLCAAKHGNVFLFDGELVHLAAVAGTDREGTEAVRRSFPQRPGPASATTRAILTRRPVIIPDVFEDPEFELTEMVRVAGFRSVMSIPMLRVGGPLGAITVTRAGAGPFSDTQLALLQTFADQAVIAIENARLFTELQEKNHALTEAHAQVTEALEQQTATAEILRVISQSQTDVQPVFDTIVRGAARLCHAVMASVLLTDGQTLYLPANYGSSPEALAAVRAGFPRPLDTESVSGAAILTRSVVHVPDVLEPSVVEFTRQAGQVLGYRSLVTVPMLREGRVVGAINVCRREPGRFSDAEVALLDSQLPDIGGMIRDAQRLMNRAAGHEERARLEAEGRGRTCAPRHRGQESEAGEHQTGRARGWQAEEEATGPPRRPTSAETEQDEKGAPARDSRGRSHRAVGSCRIGLRRHSNRGSRGLTCRRRGSIFESAMPGRVGSASWRRDAAHGRRERGMKLNASVACLLLSLSASVFADEVMLRGGGKVTGIIVGRTADSIARRNASVRTRSRIIVRCTSSSAYIGSGGFLIGVRTHAF
jgi:GAF domain-containing protein